LTDHGGPVTWEQVYMENRIKMYRKWFRFSLFGLLYLLYLYHVPYIVSYLLAYYNLNGNMVEETPMMGMYPTFPSSGVSMSL
jgi:hypothetical protein